MQISGKFTVTVDRLPSIIESIMKLPIIGEEFKIIQCSTNNGVVLICGEISNVTYINTNYIILI